MTSRARRYPHPTALLGSAVLTLLLGLASTPPAWATAPPLNISQVPLTLAVSAHPQVMFAVANSQSMDGTVTGAIMTGSGYPPPGDSSLTASASPPDYQVPAGFTPPFQGANAAGQAPYTVIQNGVEYDNSASRLNVAKAGLQAILQAYMPATDFGIETYDVKQPTAMNTWVYVTSPSGGFTFTNTPTPTERVIANPCYQYTTASSDVDNSCSSIAGLYGATTLRTNAWMVIAASSDDPQFNDVLYNPPNQLPGIFVAYRGPHPASPFAPYFNLSRYNNGQVLISYNATRPDIGPIELTPTNAGYVPYSPQVMFIARGFGYNSAAQTNTQVFDNGTTVVPITTAGLDPTAAQVNAALSQFTAALQPETNNTDSPEIKASAQQSPIAGLLVGTQQALQAANTGTCKVQQYAVLVTDGLPTQDLRGLNWPPLGSASAAGYGVTATYNADGSLASTNDQALQDAINQLAAMKKAGIQTFVIGLGAGVDPSANPAAAAALKAMAMAGGTYNYFPASSTSALVNDLNTVLAQIQAGTFSTTSATVNSTGLNTGSVVYQASYSVGTQPYGDWTGNVMAFGINPQTAQINTASPLWSAGTLLDAALSGNGWMQRAMATWNPATLAGVPWSWSALAPTQQQDLQPSDNMGPQRLDFLAGDTALDQANGGTFRNRSSLLGDIIDSNPLYIGAPNGPYGSSSYLNFEATWASRPPMLYVGANDGMLHGFNATTGQETWGYVPNAVFGNLINLTNPLYNGMHQDFVDASPQASDVQFADGSWHTILVGGEGAGGDSIFALDVTNPAAMTSSTAVAHDVLWEDTPPNAGLSFDEPAIAQINAPPGFAVFFGNGYNSPTETPTLEAVNAQTGVPIASINPCLTVPSACNTSLPNGLSSPVAVNLNGLLGYPVDVVYAGDLQGNLWAFDVDNANPALWTVRLLFKAEDASGTPQPITTAPVVSLNPNFAIQPGVMVYFGTGQLLQRADLTDTQTQSFYAVLDQGTQSGLTRADLQQQTITTLSAAQTGLPEATRTINTSTINWSTQDGWFMDLPGSGERLISDPRLNNGAVVFVTYTPATSACTVGGSSFLMDVNYATGGSFAQPELDVNGDGQLNAGDQVVSGGQTLNPVGMALGSGYAAAPTILSANLGSIHAVKLITKASGQIDTVEERGGSSGRAGWWQW